jgi:hypothetical protein
MPFDCLPPPLSILSPLRKIAAHSSARKHGAARGAMLYDVLARYALIPQQTQ